MSLAHEYRTAFAVYAVAYIQLQCEYIMAHFFCQKQVTLSVRSPAACPQTCVKRVRMPVSSSRQKYAHTAAETHVLGMY